MTPTFVPADPTAERAALVAFLTADEWPFHGRRRVTEAQAAEAIDEGHYGGEASRAFFIVRDGARVGLVTLRELDDPTPVFDLRVRAAARGQGLGRAAVRWLAEHVFTRTDKLRLEAHTRADNAAMRRVLRACGWVKEAHHREAWPDLDGRWHDAVCYCVLKRDWERGAATPVRWDDD